MFRPPIVAIFREALNLIILLFADTENTTEINNLQKKTKVLVEVSLWGLLFTQCLLSATYWGLLWTLIQIPRTAVRRVSSVAEKQPASPERLSNELSYLVRAYIRLVTMAESSALF